MALGVDPLSLYSQILSCFVTLEKLLETFLGTITYDVNKGNNCTYSLGLLWEKDDWNILRGQYSLLEWYLVINQEPWNLLV